MNDEEDEDEVDMDDFEEQYREFYATHIEVDTNILKKASRQAQQKLISGWDYVVIICNIIHVAVMVNMLSPINSNLVYT